MKESKAVYVTRRDLKRNLLHREYQLYSNRIIQNKFRLTHDVGVQYNRGRDNVYYANRSRDVLYGRKNYDGRYFSPSPKQIYTYHRSRSHTDIGVGSVKALARRRVKKIYLPSCEDRGVGSSDLSSYIFRHVFPKSRSPKTKYRVLPPSVEVPSFPVNYYEYKRTSSKCVGGPLERSECLVSAKVSPIAHTKSGSTSPKHSKTAKPQETKMSKDMKVGSMNMNVHMVTIQTQFEEPDEEYAVNSSSWKGTPEINDDLSEHKALDNELLYSEMSKTTLGADSPKARTPEIRTPDVGTPEHRTPEQEISESKIEEFKTLTIMEFQQSFDKNVEKENISPKINAKRSKEHKPLKVSSSSNSVVQDVQNLDDTTSYSKQHEMTKGKNDVYAPVAKMEKDEKTDITAKTAPHKSTSLFKRRFSAIRKSLGKKDPKKAINPRDIDTSVRDVSITSDPPSLEERSVTGSNFRKKNTFNKNISPKKYYPDTLGSTTLHNVDSEHLGSVRGMFRLWGRKFNLEDTVENTNENSVTSLNDYKNHNTNELLNEFMGPFIEKQIVKEPDIEKREEARGDMRRDDIREDATKICGKRNEKKECKKFFFFKKKAAKDVHKMQSHAPIKAVYQPQKKITTTGRCEVKDGLTVRVGAQRSHPRGKSPETKTLPKTKQGKMTPIETYDLIRAAWLLKYLNTPIESRNSVNVRWNNKMYATSSSTVFELMDNVYKGNGLALNPKSESTTEISSALFKSLTSNNVRFVQNVEAWMIPKIVRYSTPQDITKKRYYQESNISVLDKPTTSENANKNIQVTISHQKSIIDKSKAFAHTIELVMHSENYVNLWEPNSSADCIKINIPKGYFSDSSTDKAPSEQPTSEEEVYNIVEYESLRSKTVLGRPKKRQSRNETVHSKDLDCQCKSIQVTVNVKRILSESGKIVEPAMNTPLVSEDIDIQESSVYVPKMCDVVGVGIVTQRADKNTRDVPKQMLAASPSCQSHRISLGKNEFVKSYLQDDYRDWQLRLDMFSECVSDSHVACNSRHSSRVSIKSENISKSCSNMYHKYVALASSPSSNQAQKSEAAETLNNKDLCSPVTPNNERLFKQQISDIVDDNTEGKLLNTIKKRWRYKKKMWSIRTLPKDSLEVYKKRKLYAKGKSKCQNENQDFEVSDISSSRKINAKLNVKIMHAPSRISEQQANSRSMSDHKIASSGTCLPNQKQTQNSWRSSSYHKSLSSLDKPQTVASDLPLQSCLSPKSSLLPGKVSQCLMTSFNANQFFPFPLPAPCTSRSISPFNIPEDLNPSICTKESRGVSPLYSLQQFLRPPSCEKGSLTYSPLSSNITSYLNPLPRIPCLDSTLYPNLISTSNEEPSICLQSQHSSQHMVPCLSSSQKTPPANHLKIPRKAPSLPFIKRKTSLSFYNPTASLTNFSTFSAAPIQCQFCGESNISSNFPITYRGPVILTGYSVKEIPGVSLSNLFSETPSTQYKCDCVMNKFQFQIARKKPLCSSPPPKCPPPPPKCPPPPPKCPPPPPKCPPPPCPPPPPKCPPPPPKCPPPPCPPPPPKCPPPPPKCPPPPPKCPPPPCPPPPPKCPPPPKPKCPNSNPKCPPPPSSKCPPPKSTRRAPCPLCNNPHCQNPLQESPCPPIKPCHPPPSKPPSLCPICKNPSPVKKPLPLCPLCKNPVSQNPPSPPAKKPCTKKRPCPYGISISNTGGCIRTPPPMTHPCPNPPVDPPKQFPECWSGPQEYSPCMRASITETNTPSRPTQTAQICQAPMDSRDSFSISNKQVSFNIYEQKITLDQQVQVNEKTFHQLCEYCDTFEPTTITCERNPDAYDRSEDANVFDCNGEPTNNKNTIETYETTDTYDQSIDLYNKHEAYSLPTNEQRDGTHTKYDALQQTDNLYEELIGPYVEVDEKGQQTSNSYIEQVYRLKNKTTVLDETGSFQQKMEENERQEHNTDFEPDTALEQAIVPQQEETGLYYQTDENEQLDYQQTPNAYFEPVDTLDQALYQDEIVSEPPEYIDSDSHQKCSKIQKNDQQTSFAYTETTDSYQDPIDLSELSDTCYKQTGYCHQPLETYEQQVYMQEEQNNNHLKTETSQHNKDTCQKPVHIFDDTVHGESNESCYHILYDSHENLVYDYSEPKYVKEIKNNQLMHGEITILKQQTLNQYKQPYVYEKPNAFEASNISLKLSNHSKDLNEETSTNNQPHDHVGESSTYRKPSNTFEEIIDSAPYTIKTTQPAVDYANHSKDLYEEKSTNNQPIGESSTYREPSKTFEEIIDSAAYTVKISQPAVDYANHSKGLYEEKSTNNQPIGESSTYREPSKTFEEIFDSAAYTVKTARRAVDYATKKQLKDSSNQLTNVSANEKSKHAQNITRTYQKISYKDLQPIFTLPRYNNPKLAIFRHHFGQSLSRPNPYFSNYNQNHMPLSISLPLYSQNEWLIEPCDGFNNFPLLPDPLLINRGNEEKEPLNLHDTRLSNITPRIPEYCMFSEPSREIIAISMDNNGSDIKLMENNYIEDGAIALKCQPNIETQPVALKCQSNIETQPVPHTTIKSASPALSTNMPMPDINTQIETKTYKKLSTDNVDNKMAESIQLGSLPEMTNKERLNSEKNIMPSFKDTKDTSEMPKENTEQVTLVQRTQACKDPNTQTTVAVNEAASVECKKPFESPNSNESIANVVEINIKLRVMQGDKTTEINVKNDEQNIITNDPGQKLGQKRLHDSNNKIYVVNVENDQGKDKKQKNDFDIRILIKSFNPKSECNYEKKAVDDFSRKISKKFKTVSTGYSEHFNGIADCNNHLDICPSDHKATIDFITSEESKDSNELFKPIKKSEVTFSKVECTTNKISSHTSDITPGLTRADLGRNDSKTNSISFASSLHTASEPRLIKLDLIESSLPTMHKIKGVSSLTSYSQPLSKTVEYMSSKCFQNLGKSFKIFNKFKPRCKSKDGTSTTEKTGTKSDSYHSKSSISKSDFSKTVESDQYKKEKKYYNTDSSNCNQLSATDVRDTTSITKTSEKSTTKRSDDRTDHTDLTDLFTSEELAIALSKSTGNFDTDKTTDSSGVKKDSPEYYAGHEDLKKLGRDEKKSMLKQVFESDYYFKSPTNKGRVKKLKDMLKALLTSDTDSEIEIRILKNVDKKQCCGHSIKKSNCSSKKSISDSQKSSHKLSDSKPLVSSLDKSNTDILSSEDIVDSESPKEPQAKRCICSEFANKLNLTTGGCCCKQAPLLVDEQISCNFITEFALRELKYFSPSVACVYCQTSNSICCAKMLSVHSNRTSIRLSQQDNGYAKSISEIKDSVSVRMSKTTKGSSARDSDKIRVECEEFGPRGSHFQELDVCRLNSEKTRQVPIRNKLLLDTEISGASHARREHKKRHLSKFSHDADVLQMYEMKKAVLEIYTDKTVSKDGEHLIAKLPKYVHDTESELNESCKKLERNDYESVYKRNIVMCMGR